MAGGGAAYQQGAAALQALERRHPGIAAGEVDDHVDAAFIASALRLAVLFDRPFGEVDLLVVDHVVGADLGQACQLVGTAGAGDHLGTEHLGQDHAAGADPAGGAQHQHAVALFHGLVGHQHAVRGAVGHRQGGGVGEGHAGRHADQLVGGHQAIFGHAAIEHLAHQAFCLVERVDQHAVALVPAGYAGAHFDDLARHVEADHHRQRHLDARHALDSEYIVIVERRGADPDDHMPLPHHRHRMVAYVFKILQAAVLAQNQGFHVASLIVGVEGMTKKFPIA